MLTLAHRAHGGLLHEAIAWAYILSMSTITTELNARIGPSGTRWAAARDCRAGPHTFNSMSRITTKLTPRTGPSGTRCAAARDCRVGLHAFNEQGHYRAKCSHWPIGHMVRCCTRLSCGPTYFQ